MAQEADSYNLSVAEVTAGISLCKANARRLLVDASTLLEHGGRAGLAYALWSLAVEECGKAVLLDQLAADKTTSDTVSVPQLLFRGQHKEKFEAGFARIQHAVGSTFGGAVRVLQNVAEQSTTVPLPSPYGGDVSVPPFETGEREDVTPGATTGRQAAHGLRLDLLYVDWDDTQRVWRQPEPELNAPGVVGHFTISSTDLRSAIRALEAELSLPMPGTWAFLDAESMARLKPIERLSVLKPWFWMLIILGLWAMFYVGYKVIVSEPKPVDTRHSYNLINFFILKAYAQETGQPNNKTSAEKAAERKRDIMTGIVIVLALILLISFGVVIFATNAAKIATASDILKTVLGLFVGVATNFLGS